MLTMSIIISSFANRLMIKVNYAMYNHILIPKDFISCFGFGRDYISHFHDFFIIVSV